MELNTKQKEFENKFKMLINESIDNIYYELLSYEYLKEFDNSIDEHNYLNKQYDLNELHSIGLSIILETSSNNFYQITWDSEFFHYGISIQKIKKIEQKESIETLSVSNDKKLAPYLNRKILDVNIDWSYITTEPENIFTKFLKVSTPIYYPQTVIFNFGGLYLFISAAEINDNGDIYGFSDNLLLTFKEDTARQYKLID